MKKLITILLILSTGLTYGQNWIWPPLDAFNKTTGIPPIRNTALYAAQRINDSTAKVLRTDFSKADDALLSKLPVFRKGTLDSLDKLNIYLKQVTTPAVDTSWKATVRDQQATITAQGKLINDLTTQLSELKLWADRQKAKEYIINFK